MNSVDLEQIKFEFQFYTSYYKKAFQWFRREINNYDFHEVIRKVLDNHAPDNLPLLILEHPHRSINNPQNVAYTRDNASGEGDRQTVTSFGKYLRRHFSCLKDHEIRDYATKCSNDIFELWDTIEDIVISVQEGPKSCMTWDSSYTPGSEDYEESRSRRHPYRVYSPKLGWKAAVRLHPETQKIMGRALVYEGNPDDKGFVRSYKRCVDYSYSDEFLEVWLKEQGYSHWDSWPDGTQLKKIELSSGDIVAPYLDGENQCVSVEEKYLVVDSDGNLELDDTSGILGDERLTEYCDNCGDYFHEDDMVRTDDNYNGYVCCSCNDYHFVDAIGRRGEYVRIHEDNAVYVSDEDEHYHCHHLEENNIVELDSGGFSNRDNTIVHGESGGYYLLADIKNESDTHIINNSEFFYDDEVFICEASSMVCPLSRIDPIEVDGKLYHPDYAPEIEKEEENV